MKSRTKRLISILCILALVLSALPMSVLAAPAMLGEDHAHAETPVEAPAASGEAVSARSFGTRVTEATAQLFSAQCLNFSDTPYDTTTFTYTGTVESVDTGNASYTKGLKMSGNNDGVTFTAQAGTLKILMYTTQAGKGVKVTLPGDSKPKDFKSTKANTIEEYTANISAGQVKVVKNSPNVCWILKVEVVPSHEHNYTGWTVTAEPTCGETGVETGTCSVCGDKTTRPVPATGEHTFDAWTVTTEPTCTTKGVESKCCSVCGDVATGADAATRPVDMIPHTLDDFEIITPAKCGVPGQKQAKCTKCDHVESQVIPALTHEYEPGEDGVERCIHCGVKEGATICTGAHTYPANWTTLEEATCKVAGLKAKECSKCGYILTETIDKLAHVRSEGRVHVVAATCQVPSYTGDIVCRNCGEVIEAGVTGEKIDHAFDPTTHICSMCHQSQDDLTTGISIQGGDLESAYVEWPIAAGVTNYTVSIAKYGSTNFEELDDQLVRRYKDNTMRADAVGLAAGNYVMKITPWIGEEEQESIESGVLEVLAHDRSGYAFADGSLPGAYKADGTLKDGALVIYVDNSNFSTKEVTVQNAKGQDVTFTGVQEMVDTSGIAKTAPGLPVDIRIVGTIDTTGFPSSNWGSGAEGLQVKSNKADQFLNLTIEGVGKDAAIKGFGVLTRNTNGVELRNFAVLNCKDDCISVDTNNQHLWAHNLDLFYGGPGSDSDQAKGDGAIDIKANSRYCTVSYNHFWDTGKSGLIDASAAGKENCSDYLTYHHNWFDHSDSRHPRVRNGSNIHIYNNYYDGVSKYGVGITTGASAFVESNFFRNCKYPMLASLQGNDVAGGNDGTFSGEPGGIIKAYGNTIVGSKNITYYQEDNVEFDAWLAPTQKAEVPSAVTAKSGGSTYSNFDTKAGFYTYDVELPSVARQNAILWAGRVQGGDLKWQFDNATDDESYAVNSSLKAAVTGYTSSMTSVGGTVDPALTEDKVNTNPNTDPGLPEITDDPTGPVKGGATTDPGAKNLVPSEFTLVDPQPASSKTPNVKNQEVMSDADIAAVADEYFSKAGNEIYKRTKENCSANSKAEWIQLPCAVSASDATADKSTKNYIEFSTDSTAEKVTLTISCASTGSSNYSTIGVKDAETDSLIPIAETDASSNKTTYAIIKGSASDGKTTVKYALEAGHTYRVLAPKDTSKTMQSTRVYLISVSETLPKEDQEPTDDAVANKSALTSALRSAGSVKKATTQVAAGTAGTAVPANCYWADDTAFATLNTAIASAEEVMADGEATQTQVNTAVANLNAAIAAFEEVRTFGAADPDSGSGTVTTTDPTGVTISGSASVTVGSTIKLSASVKPSNASTKTVTWESSDPTVATVTGGTVAGLKAGTTTITATVTGFDAVKATKVITVTAPADTPTDTTPVAVASVGLNKTTAEVEVNKTLTLVATVGPANATNKAVTWASSKPAIATVSDAGVVTGKATGTATITVTTADGGKTASCTVTVTPKSVDKAGLNSALSAAEALAAAVKVDTDAANVDKGTYWVTAAVMKELTDAIAAAKDLAAAATQAQVDAAAKALNDAAAAVTAAATEGTKDTGSSTPAGNVHTFESKTLTETGNTNSSSITDYSGDSYFKLAYVTKKTKYDTSTKEWTAEKFGANAYCPGGKNEAGEVQKAVRFSPGTKLAKNVGPGIVFTPTASKVTVQIWWVQGGGDTLNKGVWSAEAIRQIGVYKLSDASVVKNATNQSAVTALTQPDGSALTTDETAATTDRIKANDPMYTEFADLTVTAGTQYIVSNPSAANYIFKVVVTEQAEGGSTAAPVDKTALNTAITAAETELAKPTVSADGTDVAAPAKWVSQADYDAFLGAINAAKAVKITPDAAQSKVDSAVSALNTAKAAFLAAQAEGTKGAAPDPGDDTKYTVTLRLTDLKCDDYPSKIAANEQLKIKLGVITSKYTLPNTITVKMGGYTLSARKGDYTYDATGGFLTIPKVTGNVVITAAGVYKGSPAPGDGGGSSGGGGGGGAAAPAEPTTPDAPKPATGTPYVDVKDSDWFYAAAKSAYTLGLMKGTSADRFSPADTTTRAMVATVLFRLDGEKSGDVTGAFSDVSSGQWYTQAVEWAADKGVVKGYEDGTFAPNANVTREQLAVMLFRYADPTVLDKSDALGDFADAASVSDWAVDALQWAVKVGVITGKDGKALDPQGMATRAEVCTMLIRFVNLPK